MHTTAVLTFALALSIPAFLQARESELRFERITAEDGLPQTQIVELLQDRRGFLWIGSTDGLYRYDGIRFLHYSASPAAGSLPHSHVVALVEDRRGVLWVGTYGGGIARFEPVTETFSRPSGGAGVRSLDRDQITVMIDGADGALWIGTYGNGLVRLDHDAGKLVRYRNEPEDPSSLVDDRVTALCESPPGILWIGTDSGLVRLDQELGAFVRFRHDPEDPSSLADDHVSVVRPRREGGLWVGTQGGGLDRFDPASGVFFHHERFAQAPFHRVSDVFEDKAGTLWAGTAEAGLMRLDPAAARFDHARHDPADPTSLTDDNIVSLYEDRGGIVWISTRVGLNKLNPLAQAFAHITADPFDADSLAGPRVRAVHEDRSGDLWIGTTKGLDRLERDTGRFEHYRHDPAEPSSLAADHVTAILEDRQDRLWVGSLYDGLSRLDRRAGHFTHYVHDPADPASLGFNDVTFIHEDRSENFWIGSWGGGLDRFEPVTETFTHYRHDASDPRSLGDDNLLAFHEGPAGELWIGTADRGIAQLDSSTGTFANFRFATAGSLAPTADRIPAIYQEPSGVLWLGTWGSGLIRFEPVDKEFRAYTRQDGLPGDAVFGILPDDEGRLWLSTVHGLARFDPRDESCRRFDARDGLRSNEFNIHSSVRGRRGELFFGGNQGLTLFDPARVEINTHVPPVVLTSFQVSGRPFELEQPLAEIEVFALDHRNAVVVLEFAALDYSAPRKNRFAYRLEGAGDGWIDLGTRNEVVWPHLEPGEHVLQVKGSNNHGVWNETGLTVRLAVSPPWWSTWWFRASATAALAALVFAAYRWRVHLVEAQNRALQLEIHQRRQAEKDRERLIGELEAQNAELERFTYTVSHDLKAPLVTIRGFLGFLGQDVKAGDAGRIESDMNHIENAAGTMARILDELLVLSRMGRVVHAAEAIDLGELAREAERMVAGSVAESGAELLIAPDLPVVTGDRIRLLEVFVNLIENGMKFLGDQAAPLIEVGVRREAAEEVIYVRDNGIGIDPRYHTKVFDLFERVHTQVEGTGIGLALVKRIVEVHGGRIWVESLGAGAGSTFCFTFGQVDPPVT